MSTALLSGLIILVLLVIMLIAGVPIAVALGISSICADRSPEDLFRDICVQPAGYTVLYPGRQYHEQGRHRSPSDQSCEISHRPCARRAGPHKCGGKHAFWRPVQQQLLPWGLSSVLLKKMKDMIQTSPLLPILPQRLQDF